ncbi:MAG TPA: bifunctional glutamate N-acetyltransferase/amino-acid acetyltransferase ArgJ [Candidatus Binatia bacterium]|nr:bifunctional glutamate N-acetyltransferase/amino-acid acetyltransferase ArgJ [Candidatus Binatia bacterium]
MSIPGVPEVGAETADGVCAPIGFAAGTASADVRGDGAKRDDIAVIASDRPCAAAGVFTRNLVKAAPVVISQLTLRRGTPIHAVVLNSGNANACTGAQGLRDALRMCALTADALGRDPVEVVVCSTGVIGRPLPMSRVADGIRGAVRSLGRDAGGAAARSIMTTDTVPKTAVAHFRIMGVEHRVGGMAKGSGMIHPDMATLLALVTTDADVAAPDLQALLGEVADRSFNAVTVDGDTSTNDTLLALANGAAGGPRLVPGGDGYEAFRRAVLDVCEDLAEQVVADAEGATKHFRVSVTGAVDRGEARLAARTVALSPLVKTAVHGADPNWGRIIMALGRSGAHFTLDRCRVVIAGTTVFERGAPAEVDLDAVSAALHQPRIEIGIHLGAGDGEDHAWGCDLSAGYVRINAEYTT